MARRCLLAFKLKLPAATDRTGRARPAAVIAVAWAGSQGKIRKALPRPICANSAGEKFATSPRTCTCQVRYG